MQTSLFLSLYIYIYRDIIYICLLYIYIYSIILRSRPLGPRPGGAPRRPPRVRSPLSPCQWRSPIYIYIYIYICLFI